MVYGCIAEKLSHSFSKEIHNRLFDYEYELCEVPSDSLDSFMQKKNFKAINVTIPYKERVIPHLDYISDIAKQIGAVNTVVNDNGILKGYNTDFSGMSMLLEKNGIDLKNKKVLILGSGGTSKTAFAVAQSQNCSSVYRVSRSANNGCISYEEATEKHCDADIIINTTPVGMYPVIDKTPIDLIAFQKLSAVIDAIYNPLNSKLIIGAKSKGIKAVGGLYMLVAQAAFAAEHFINTKVPKSEIDRVYGEILSVKQNVVLVGMPGSGKTTIGKLLAQELGMSFYDTDELIVDREKKSIPEIFAQFGEATFRKLESEVILDLSKVQNAVIATGGGAILNQDNISSLKQNGKIIFIDRDINDIAATSDRPLSSNRADLEKRYRERYPIYCKICDYHIEATNEKYENMQKLKKVFLNENTCD